MGYDIPGAIGVGLARPNDGEVYVFLGDGNYLLHPMELKTAVQEGIKLTVILLKNDGIPVDSRTSEGPGWSQPRQ